MKGIVLAIDSARFSYGGPEVLRGITLLFEPGTVSGIVGPNGSGKSTLLKCACGLLKPSSGACYLNGRNVPEIPATERARMISWCPQEVSFAFPFTAFETALLGRTPYLGAWGLASERDRGIVSGSLESVDMLHLAARSVDMLSGGERKRVMLARTLAQQTPVIILDEPTAGLDIGHQSIVMRALVNLAAGGAAVVVSLHDLNEASAWCDRVVLMKAGSVLSDGAPANVLTAEAIRAAFGVDVSVVSAFGRAVISAGPEDRSGRSTGLADHVDAPESPC